MAVRVGPEIEAFATALDDCLVPHGTADDKRARILALVNSYYDYAAERLAHLRNRIRLSPAGDADMDLDEDEQAEPSTRSEDLRVWEQEMQTWDLIRRLLPLRYPAPNQGSKQASTTPRTPHQSRDLWSAFVEKDHRAIERKTILEWLQQGARSGPDIDELVRELQQNADRGDIIAHGWIHTRSAIKLQKGVIGSSRPLDVHFPEVSRSLVNSDRAPLVGELDPDAVTRQGRKLEPQDEYFERAIWVGCYHLLRRGSSLETIREWCLERTEVWRAVSMSALPLASEHGEAKLIDDPSALVLWRRMCFALARQGGSDDVERAVYGLLSGDIPSVERVCKTWDDFMFMHYNALIRTEFDNYALSQCPPEVSASLRSSFTSFDAVHFLGDPATLEQRLVKSLETNPQTCDEASEPTKTLQAAIISRDMERYFYEQGVVVTQKANSKEPSALMPDDSCRNVGIAHKRFADIQSPEKLRLVVHALIVFSALDSLGLASESAALSPQYERRQLQENTITAYVSLLRLAGLEELIPLYCSRLGGPRAFQVLSTNLLSITDNDARVLQLNLIHKAGLDTLKFVKTQPQILYQGLHHAEGYPAKGQFHIMEDQPPSLRYGRPIKTDFFGEDPESIDPADERLIRSIEWLLLVSEAWPSIFTQGVAVYKYFLKHMRLNAARSLASRVPFSAIIRQKVDISEQDENELWAQDGDFWASQIGPSDAASVTSNRLASDARTMRELEYLVKALDTMETIASLAELSKEDPSVKRDFWTKVGNEVKSAKEHVQPLLRNWLLSTDDAELETLRDVYLPETLLAYISTLHFAGTTLTRDNFLECMELAAVVAEKHSDVASCFVKANRMKEMVEAFAACSKALAVSSGEKKTAGASSKKLREMGWSRDLWSIKS